ncbi:hypothetical protein [Marinicellulosiphila megalodicopiae]|uniref:hypothetical protein n=1 Tax=Marinicellulosiphila megalodicopiae TaxID=2724896 RepID=UPI003BB09022
MSHSHKIAIFDPEGLFPFLLEFSEQFALKQFPDVSEVNDCNLELTNLILICHKDAIQGIELAAKINQQQDDMPPSVLFVPDINTEERIKAYQEGVDDLPEKDITADEFVARCFRLIFDQIANKQLKSQIVQANKMAFMAMANTSDLGINIQFLLDCNQCKDLNELGVCLLNSLKNYDLHCSLQIRGKFEERNMEENGMPREMESQLLSQMKDRGRYYDFGQRSIMNYENVSILVKNMPIEDEAKYGMIKDNVFSLLQGLSARVIALDNEIALEQEMETIMMLTQRMQKVMSLNEEASMQTMKLSIENLEDVAVSMESLLPFLGITLEQEDQIESILSTAIETNQTIFSQALQKDDEFGTMLTKINHVLLNKVDGKVDFEQLHRLM